MIIAVVVLVVIAFLLAIFVSRTLLLDGNSLAEKKVNPAIKRRQSSPVNRDEWSQNKKVFTCITILVGSFVLGWLWLAIFSLAASYQSDNVFMFFVACAILCIPAWLVGFYECRQLAIATAQTTWYRDCLWGGVATFFLVISLLMGSGKIFLVAVLFAFVAAAVNPALLRFIHQKVENQRHRVFLQIWVLTVIVGITFPPSGVAFLGFAIFS